MSVPGLSSLLFLFSFLFSIYPIKGSYGMEMKHFDLSEIETFENVNILKRGNEFIISTNVNHTAIPIKKTKIARKKSDRKKNYSECRNRQCKKALTDKERTKGFFDSCQPDDQMEEMERMIEERVGKWATRLQSIQKREMLIKFTDKFHLEEDYPDCRNKTCETPLRAKDGPAICQACCSFYRRTGKIRANKNLISREEKNLIFEEINQNLKNTKSFNKKKSSSCHDPKCDNLLTKKEKGDFCYSCFPLNERIKDPEEGREKVNSLVEKNGTISDIKTEILLEFSDILDLSDYDLECRNRYCRKSLDPKDGPAICQQCRRWYEKKKKLRGKDLPIRREIISPRRTKKLVKKGKRKSKCEIPSKKQKLKFNEQEKSKIETDYESTEKFFEKAIEEIPILPPLSPFPDFFPESFDPIPELNQSFQQKESLLNEKEFLDNMGNQLDNYDASNIINFEEISNDLLELVDSIGEID